MIKAAPTVLLFASLCTAAAVPGLAHAHSAIDLFDFDGASGYAPDAGVIADRRGVLYGTTPIGGNGPCFGGAGCGTVYALSPPSGKGGSWALSVLHEFQDGTDGESPQAPLALGSSGALYGYSNGTSGTVFQLQPNGGSYAFNVLYTFPGGGLDLNTVGAPLSASGKFVYGIASGGSGACGQFGCGGVFRLKQGHDGTWKEQTLYSFSGGVDSGEPIWMAGPDAARALYVCTRVGNGAVVQLVPPADGHGAWTENVISAFSGRIRAPTNLLLAPDGSLFGIAYKGRGSAVFQLTPGNGGTWVRTIVATVTDHGYGANSLALQDDGSLIGAIEGDVDFFAGAVFQLSPPGDGGQWIFRQLWNFNRGPDRNPLDAIPGKGGRVFGVTMGGDSTNGSLFELK